MTFLMLSCQVSYDDFLNVRKKIVQALVAVIMGAHSDWETMQHVELTLSVLGIPNEVKVISAHRTPDLLANYGHQAEKRGLEVIVAGGTGAAHLPGMMAAYTLLPVIGVPIPSTELNGLDALLSIAQMQAGVPVATMSIGRSGAINAALFAAQILGRKHPKIHEAILEYRRGQTQKILDYTDPRNH